MTVVVREWRNEDSAAIRGLVRETLPEYGFEADPSTSEKDLEDIDASYFRRGGEFFVLELNGAVIGTVGFFGVDGTTCKLRKMYVRKGYRGEGLGKLLLEVAITKATQRGYRAMILETNSRMREAIGLYLASGFREIPIAPASPRCDTSYRLELRK